MTPGRLAARFVLLGLTVASVPAFAAAQGPAAAKGAAAVTAAVSHPAREVLPERVVPVHYNLVLEPDTEALTFKATVTIIVDMHSSGTTVTLNAAELTFDAASLDGGPKAVVTLDEKLGRATLRFGAPVAAGRHTLVIDYHGKISRTTIGFFAMDYIGPDGPRRTLATNFEPAEARRLLPCWDEPGRKATFTVSVDAPKDRMVVSNMPVADVTVLSPETQRVRFVQTPKMSTYLLFVGIGDFERVHTRTDGVEIGIVVKRGDTGKAAYALDQAAKILRYYNAYFGVAFPLPKLDLIAAPGQIQGGSMENWGAIFYSQNHLLFDPKTSTEEDRQGVFLVVSHEMAHQWFGDLVTMSWWDDLWLNEGFARWMQTFAADDLHPEWETGLQAAGIFEEGKQADSVPSTHPVVQEVFTADQAGQSFDSITYDKGAAIITMINAYVGRDKFRDGVRRYMHAHAFGNTVDTDLWQPVQEAAGQPILGLEHDFTRQEGLPLVRAAHTAQGVRLEQSRFVDDPTTLSKQPPQHWLVPLAVGPIAGEHTYLLLEGSADLAQPPPLLINAGQMGYARVLYGSDLLEGLTAALGSLQPIDQLGLLNDAHAFGIAGIGPAPDTLKLAAALPAAANPVVWDRVLEVLSEIEWHYANSPQRTAFRRFALDLLAPLAARLGANELANEAANVQILRGHLQAAESRFGDAAVIEGARRRLDSGSGSPTEQRTALTIVAAQADVATFDALLARAMQKTDPLEKQRIYRALAGVIDPDLARRMTDIAVSDKVPAGTTPALVVTLAHWHPDLIWDTLAPRLDDPKLPLSKSLRWRVAGSIAAFSSLPQRIEDLEAYEARSVPPEARKPFLESEATIRQNQRITGNMLPQIDKWIESRGAAPAVRH